jgi:hypothetical protein
MQDVEKERMKYNSRSRNETTTKKLPVLPLEQIMLEVVI